VHSGLRVSILIVAAVVIVVCAFALQNERYNGEGPADGDGNVGACTSGPPDAIDVPHAPEDYDGLVRGMAWLDLSGKVEFGWPFCLFQTGRRKESTPTGVRPVSCQIRSTQHGK